MAAKPAKDFGRRPPVVPPGPPAAPSKRSRNVALLLMGTVAIGGGAYAMMPSETCQPNPPGVAAGPGQPNNCAPRGSSSSSGSGHSSSGGSSSRSGFYGSNSSSSGTSSSSSSSGHSESGHVARGGFGAFAGGVAAHFSGGG